MNISKISSEDLKKELERRENNPTWFIRDLVSEGHDLDNDDFRDATNWMEDNQSLKFEE